MKLELFYYAQCPFCHMVVSHIKKLDLTEKIIFKNTLEDPANRDFHMKTTGRTTVPCLYIDGKPMFESRDIMEWLTQNKDKIKA